jgi:2-polyprenyl-3-methyl-5-hydroxy-6-metoxy-1,4-benzoquinol methylase
VKHINAPLVGFETVPAIEDMLLSLGTQYSPPPARRYPFRYLRYWFVRHSLANLQSQLQRPLRVLEVGIGLGKMLAFMDGEKIGPHQYALPKSIERWDALDVQADPKALKRYSYSSFIEVDLDQPFELKDSDYDAVILLHVLEHLKSPEQTMTRLLGSIQRGGAMVGGSPTMPNFLARIHERQLHRKYRNEMSNVRAHRHLSVITPARLRNFAKAEHLDLDLLSGAYMLRSSSSPLEDHSWWLRANLAWGAVFPSLGCEVYFALRKT